jgi:hypothetical protein
MRGLKDQLDLSCKLTLSPSISPLLPFLLSSSTRLIASSILLSRHNASNRRRLEVGNSAQTPFGPTIRVSATAVEKGRRGLAPAWSEDEERLVARSCLGGFRGDEGGVRPDPDGGSSLEGGGSSA